ncbi:MULTISPECIES: YlxR family protein [Pseudonocardia]|uniref:YlxR family protein n=1 Tax=Pseudonocardia TaxID=1847 RepID=UPI002D78958B|nr:YlxR family protein [Pseudonocardia dioxanivorans]
MAHRHPQRLRPAQRGRRARRGDRRGDGYGVGRLIGDALHSDPARCHGPSPDRPSAGTGARTASGPVRTCVGCRTRVAACGLLRVAVVDGVLTPDPRRRLPGRGAWLHLDPECLDRAERRSAFPRALRVPGPLDVSAVRSHLQSRGARETPAPDTPGSKVDPS